MVEPLTPELDAEALLVSAALYSRDRSSIREIGNHLSKESFDNPHYGEIFDVIVDLAAAEKLFDPASVRGEFSRRGEGNSVTATSILTLVTTLGANDLELRHYAAEVSSQAYRRSYHQLAAHIEFAASHAAEDELFDRLVEQGRLQRQRWNEHTAFCEKMTAPTTARAPSSQESTKTHLMSASPQKAKQGENVQLCEDAQSAQRLLGSLIGSAPAASPVETPPHTPEKQEELSVPESVKAEL